ncbi:MAG: hypothetical protein GWO20_16450 [Candidatus Korarchaeota archaeon]|nr:hypothetical protein [Candidatus Korarchaeota archaeon]NIU85093.1 hypothetical protein [Candidatus Thorarchaeota archaeon]NIW15020.1 hypothetical protein [Candidatus Thorarchaeota archaeon]NIW53030.1 hypothetical protein [Candidatus Korarchaeota archaeon]
MRKKRKNAIQKVRDAVRNENRELAIEHAKIAVIYSKDLVSLAKSKAKIVQSLNFLQRSTLTKSLSEVIQDLAVSLGEIREEIASPSLRKALSTTVKESEKLDIRTDMLYETLDMANVGGRVEKAAQQLVEEIAVEEGVSEKPVKKALVSDEEVSKLLDEVKEDLD